jgi:PAP2 superfamily protein
VSWPAESRSSAPGAASTRPPLESEPHADPGAERRAVGLRWWREVLYILAFYLVYSVVRNMQGSASVSKAHALEHAREIIDLERWLHIFNEQAVQKPFLDYRGFIEFWNLFYGTFHFFVTIGALLWLFRRFPERYPKWRNVLACTTGVALVGFAVYPLLPPRLLPPSFGFVDTLRVYGSPWSFDSGAMHKISNQYAAMPSLHFGWSAWCALVLVSTLPRTWMKAIAALYPFATTFSIVVTANHYWLDAVGGAIALAIGYGLGVLITDALARRRRVLRPVEP